MNGDVVPELLDELVAELHRAWAFTDALWLDLTDAEIRWRPNENSERDRLASRAPGGGGALHGAQPARRRAEP